MSPLRSRSPLAMCAPARRLPHELTLFRQVAQCPRLGTRLAADSPRFPTRFATRSTHLRTIGWSTIVLYVFFHSRSLPHVPVTCATVPPPRPESFAYCHLCSHVDSINDVSVSFFPGRRPPAPGPGFRATFGAHLRATRVTSERPFLVHHRVERFPSARNFTRTPRWFPRQVAVAMAVDTSAYPPARKCLPWIHRSGEPSSPSTPGTWPTPIVPRTHLACTRVTSPQCRAGRPPFERILQDRFSWHVT